MTIACFITTISVGSTLTHVRYYLDDPVHLLVSCAELWLSVIHVWECYQVFWRHCWWSQFRAPSFWCRLVQVTLFMLQFCVSWSFDQWILCFMLPLCLIACLYLVLLKVGYSFLFYLAIFHTLLLCTQGVCENANYEFWVDFHTLTWEWELRNPIIVITTTMATMMSQSRFVNP